MKVREIQVDDVFTVARMLGKITKDARSELAAAMVADKTDTTELGMVLVQSICIEAEEDLKAWLADLAGKKTAEFLKMPATALIDVVEGLMQQEGIKDFFARASQLANKLTSGS